MKLEILNHEIEEPKGIQTKHCQRIDPLFGRFGASGPDPVIEFADRGCGLFVVRHSQTSIKQSDFQI